MAQFIHTRRIVYRHCVIAYTHTQCRYINCGLRATCHPPPPIFWGCQEWITLRQLTRLSPLLSTFVGEIECPRITACGISDNSVSVLEVKSDLFYEVVLKFREESVTNFTTRTQTQLPCMECYF